MKYEHMVCECVPSLNCVDLPSAPQLSLKRLGSRSKPAVHLEGKLVLNINIYIDTAYLYIYIYTPHDRQLRMLVCSPNPGTELIVNLIFLFFM